MIIFMGLWLGWDGLNFYYIGNLMYRLIIKHRNAKLYKNSTTGGFYVTFLNGNAFDLADYDTALYLFFTNLEDSDSPIFYSKTT